MKRVIKLFIAFLLFPTACLVLLETAGAFLAVLKDFQIGVGLLAGAALYCVIHFGGYKFGRMYVWGHEATHAIVAMLCGFRVHSITVNKDSGNVKMDRMNAVVVLAPYFVPLYAIITGFVYLAIDLFWNAAPYRSVFVFIVGFFMAFHFVQTFKTLWETDQPDLILAGGRIFSTVIIILCNAAVLLLVLDLLFPNQVKLLDIVYNVGYSSFLFWKQIAAAVYHWMTSKPA